LLFRTKAAYYRSRGLMTRIRAAALPALNERNTTAR
jgi:hypothetical protein